MTGPIGDPVASPDLSRWVAQIPDFLECSAHVPLFHPLFRSAKLMSPKENGHKKLRIPFLKEGVSAIDFCVLAKN